MPGYQLPSLPGAIPSQIAPAYQPISFGQVQFLKENPRQSYLQSALAQTKPEEPGFMNLLGKGLGEGLGAGIKAGISEKFEEYSRQKEAERQIEANRIKTRGLRPTLAALNVSNEEADALENSGMAPEQYLPFLKERNEALKARGEQSYAQNLANYLSGGPGLVGQGQQQVQQQIQGQKQPQVQINPQIGQPEIVQQSQQTAQGQPIPKEEQIPLIEGEPAPEIPLRFQNRRINVPAIKPTEQLQLAKMQQKDISDQKKEELEFIKPYVKDINDSRAGIRGREQGLNNAERAIKYADSRMLGDLFAKWTGLDFFSTLHGSQLQTAMKEHLIGNVSKFGARPNMYIEQQVSQMGPRFGLTPEANQSIIELLRNGVDVEKFHNKVWDETSKYYLDKIGFVPREAIEYVDRRTADYQNEKNDELAMKLREIEEKAMPESELNSLRMVPEGTPLTEKKAEIISSHPSINNDPVKFYKVLKRLHYKLPPEVEQELTRIELQEMGVNE